MHIIAKRVHGSQEFIRESVSLFALCLLFRYTIKSVVCSCFILFFLVESWLPNVTDEGKSDYHTVYVVEVQYDDILENKPISWQLMLRYSQFKEAYDRMRRTLAKLPTRAEFPLAKASHWLLGLSDEVRHERKEQLHIWLKEISQDPLLMTSPEITHAFFDLLEVSGRVLRE